MIHCVEESMRNTHGPGSLIEGDAQTEKELDTDKIVQGALVHPVKIRCRAPVQVARNAEDRVSRLKSFNARRALEGDAVAPSNERTWKFFRGRNKKVTFSS